MAELVVSLKNRVLQRIPLLKQHVTIGREPSNDVVIDNDSVSRCHAVVAYEGGRFIVRDNGSANGIFANGAQVQAHVFTDATGIQIGKFTVEVDESAGPSVDRIEQHDASDDTTGEYVAPSPLRTTHLTVDELERALRAATEAAGNKVEGEGPRWPRDIAPGAPEPAPRTVGSFQKTEPGPVKPAPSADDRDPMRWMLLAMSTVVVVLLIVVFWLVSKL